MKINYLLLFISTLFISSCQTAKQVEDAEEKQIEKLAQKITQEKQDSLQLAFCDCLVEDSISREEKLKNIDGFLAQHIDINSPCTLNEQVFSSSAETALINLGVSVSNRILRTKFRKRSSKANTITKKYPILMLFNEDTIMLQELINRGSDINKKTSDIVSLPEYYVSQNNLVMTKFALNLGAIPKQINIITNNEEIIDFLLASGSESKNIDKVTLFEKENYKELAKKYQINLSSTSCNEFQKIVEVTNFGKINFERTKWLLENGVNVSCLDGHFLQDIIDENFDGRIFSARAKKKPNQHTRKEWIDLVGKYKVNWNQCASFGKSPLMLAIEKHNLELIKMLLSQGTKPNFACEFAGKQKTALETLEKKQKYAEENEARKREQGKYSKKDAIKHDAYMKKLDEIRILLK